MDGCYNFYLSLTYFSCLQMVSCERLIFLSCKRVRNLWEKPLLFPLALLNTLYFIVYRNTCVCRFVVVCLSYVCLSYYCLCVCRSCVFSSCPFCFIWFFFLVLIPGRLHVNICILSSYPLFSSLSVSQVVSSSS